MLKPNRLRPGDHVAIVSLSRGMLGEEGFIHKYHIAKERLERDFGLTVEPMSNALKGMDYLYQHPEARAQDLMDAFRDSTIKGVFNAIGGDDTIRLLPYIDFDVIRNNPKIFTGFSDTTTNHMMMHKAGLVSYYGASVMNNFAEYVAINAYTNAAIRSMLIDPQPITPILCSDFCSYAEDKIRWKEENMDCITPQYRNTGYELLQGSGRVTGRLLGGCVDVFPELLGTSLWPTDWQNVILLLEHSEANMPAEVFVWFLRNLHAQGILHQLSGIIVGKPPFRNQYEPYKAALRQVIGREAKLPDLPILYNVNVGHAYPIGLFPLGLNYEIDCDRKTLTLMEPATL